MLKVSPKNNGFQHLVLGAEDLVPGDTIPRHQHLGQDEVVFVQSGASMSNSAIRNAICMPEEWLLSAYTWVSLKNNGPAGQLRIHLFGAWIRGSLALRVRPGERETDPDDTRGRATVRSRRARYLQGPGRRCQKVRAHRANGLDIVLN